VEYSLRFKRAQLDVYRYAYICRNARIYQVVFPRKPIAIWCTY
jgi:hypothetical protein